MSPFPRAAEQPCPGYDAGTKRRIQEATHLPLNPPLREAGSVPPVRSPVRSLPRPLPRSRHPNLETSGFSDHRPSRDQPLRPFTPPTLVLAP